ncbi:pyrroline-5-carboxylate reductase 3 isoform X2 [Prorops nasuta]|uniref:pyrroline-5-carboxylate reductase 3 isoform X2 n=1 Tax=Prorops nasuta TaxID=863751 RepID=UPI0034CE343A
MEKIPDLKSLKVGFIGGGNMASAIGAGLIHKEILCPKNVWVSARTEKTLKFWSDIGAKVTLKNGEVIENCDVIFLAMKPHMLDEALSGAKQTLSKEVKREPRVVRSMPNTPMMVGEGITVYCSENATISDMNLVDTLFSYIGISERIPESLIGPIGGLSGSGPAYAYLITEALADGAVKMGVPRPMATKFAAQVLIGAGKMVLETCRHPGQLKDEVCSPGGTSIAGIHALELGNVRGSVMSAVEAAVNKSNELASKF